MTKLAFHMHLKRFVTLIAVAAALSGCSEKPVELTLVTPLVEVDREIVADLHELFANENVLTNIRLTEQALSEQDAIDAVLSGQADLALVSNTVAYHPELATVMPLYPTVLHMARRHGVDLVAAADSAHDLTVYAGPEGAVTRGMFERIATRIGIDFGAYRFVESPVEVPDIVIVFAPISPERLAEYPDLVLASVETPAEIGQGGIVDAAVLLNPHFRPFVIPVGTYGDATPEPIVTIAVDQMLVTRSNVEASVVYDLIGDVLRLRPALAAKRPGLFHNLSGDFDPGRSRFMLHAGTQDYLQREEPSVYERYSGIAEVVVTLFVAIASASVAGVRIYQRRRKNRIDEFYSQTIALQRSVTKASTPDERANAIRAVRDLQVRAFDLLVDEKLAADESFRIFITLSNDVLQQLEVGKEG
jgi:TRAP-type uncharacterized transport system substrate-binding protein